MDWTQIIVAVIAFAGTAMGTFYGIKKSNSLAAYRLKQLEEKVYKHNNMIERLYKVEDRSKSNSHRIEKLEEQQK